MDFIEQRPLLIHEEGHPALHAVEELTRRESVERRAAPRHGVDHALGALTRVVAQEPFARRGDHCLVEVVQGTLIGDVEGGQSLDLVTEEVETNRLVSLRRPEVDDAPTNRELGAVFDEALASIAEACE